MSDAIRPPDVRIQANWALDPAMQSSATNSFLVQAGTPTTNGQPDGFYLTFGHVNPPVFNLTPGAVVTQEIADGTVLPVIPVARVFMTHQRLVDVYNEIGRILKAVEGN